MKLGQTYCPETSATIYNSTLRKIPEDRRYHLRCSGSLKQRRVISAHITIISSIISSPQPQYFYFYLHPGNSVVSTFSFGSYDCSFIYMYYLLQLRCMFNSSRLPCPSHEIFKLRNCILHFIIYLPQNKLFSTT